jgi:dienelactone hydrolase
MRDTINGHNYDYGVQFARAGFITACPDARGFGERREPNKQGDRKNPNLLLSNSCHELTLAGAPLGLTVQGMWTWDLMRLLDLLSKDSRIDTKRVGCAGLSGGGMQTLDLVALDTRIKAAVDSGYFYGVRESLQVTNGHCMCNMVPHLWEHFDMGDIGALAAPRGLMIETGNADPLNGSSNLANVRSQVAISRKVFRALGANDRLQHHVFDGNHRWSGEESIPWMQELLCQ